MPQEFHVVQCYSCKTFQVDIIKKVAKWSCKICGEKQSVKKVFNRGNGKGCRLFVQESNEKRIISDDGIHGKSEFYKTLPVAEIEYESKCVDPGRSKWDEFMQNTDNNIEFAGCDDSLENGTHIGVKRKLVAIDCNLVEKIHRHGPHFCQQMRYKELQVRKNIQVEGTEIWESHTSIVKEVL